MKDIKGRIFKTGAMFSMLILLSAPLLLASGSSEEAVSRVTVALPPAEVETNYFWQGTPGNFQQHEPALETLVGNDPVTNEPVPRLAESWEHNADFTEWTFYLRKGVEFHNGYGEFTSEDVLHTLELLGREDSRSDFNTHFEKTEAIDEYTVRFVMTEQRPDALDLFSRTSSSSVLYITSKAQWEETGELGMQEELIGTGPFRFKERMLGEGLVFERIDDHWRGDTPDYEELEMRWVPEESTRLAMLLSGEADMALVGRDSANEAVSQGFRLVQSELETMQVTVLMVGPWLPSQNEDITEEDKESALSDIRVRQALNRAVDREEIRETIYQGRASELDLFGAMDGNLGWDSAFSTEFDDTYGYNPEHARELLAEAGYGEGELEITIDTYPLAGQPELFDLADALYGYFQDVGIDASIRDWDSYGAFLSERDGGTAYGNLYFMRNTPIRNTQSFIRGLLLESGWGFAYADDRIEDMYFNQFEPSLNLEERDRVAREIFDYYFDQYSTIPIASTHTELVADPDVIREWTWPAQSPTITSHWYMLRTSE